jgi:hypothetical protein
VPFQLWHLRPDGRVIAMMGTVTVDRRVKIVTTDDHRSLNGKGTQRNRYQPKSLGDARNRAISVRLSGVVAAPTASEVTSSAT